MLFFVFTTGLCNLKCDYCGGSFPESLVPATPKYKLRTLTSFLEEDSSPTVAFYGGEPLLNTKFIERFIDSFEADRYVIQTNGLLVDKLEPRYWRMFDTVLLSVDGVEEVTDRHRGLNVYKNVVKNAGKLRRLGFNGDLVARMTVTEDTDIRRDVEHLLSLKLFDHVHWQLNVVWSSPWKDFRKWVYRSYRPGLASLLKLWVEELRRGVILGIAPIQGCLKRLIGGGVSPPCGAGVEAYAISTDGKVLACPIAVDVEWGRLGDIKTNSISSLKPPPKIGEPCTSCRYFKVCGGRCLYAYIEKLWGWEGFYEICRVTGFTVSLVETYLAEIEEASKTSGLSLPQLVYPPYNNSIEIIP